MNRKSAFRWTAAAFVAALAAAAPAAASASQPNGMLAAMQRDLGLTADQATARIAGDLRASAIEPALAKALGDSFAGAWIDSGRLVVAVTDASRAGEVRAAGAEPRLVARGHRELSEIKSRLDRLAAPRSVFGWSVDAKSNSVVVQADSASRRSAVSFVESAGADPGAVRIEEVSEAPRVLQDVRGGDAYYISKRYRCSIGFSIRGGFVTAGHCGVPGELTEGGTPRVAQGTVRNSTFPGAGDFGWVEVNAGWTPVGVVNNYAGGVVEVAGSQEAAVGAAVCRSGSTTGWKCGTIESKDNTVNYVEGAVTGLTKTNACAEGGDSGGSWLTGKQAQGVTSGGRGNCTAGGIIYFQPVNEILGSYGLALITDGSEPPPPPCAHVQPWDAKVSYQPGHVVTRGGHRYVSLHWSTGADPLDPRSWAIWKDTGSCTP